MTEMLHLVAVPGRSFPREDARFRFVEGTEDAPLVVPSTAYYRRGIDRGDIRNVTPKRATKGKE